MRLVDGAAQAIVRFMIATTCDSAVSVASAFPSAAVMISRSSEVRGIGERLRGASGCILARMSGSAPPSSASSARALKPIMPARDLREKWPGYWVAAAPLIGV